MKESGVFLSSSCVLSKGILLIEYLLHQGLILKEVGPKTKEFSLGNGSVEAFQKMNSDLTLILVDFAQQPFDFALQPLYLTLEVNFHLHGRLHGVLVKSLGGLLLFPLLVELALGVPPLQT